MNFVQMLKEDFENLKLVLSKKSFIILFFVLFFVLSFLYAILNNVFVLSLFSFNVELNFVQTILVFIISLLSSLTLTVLFYRFKQNKSLKVQDAPGFLGSILAFFTTSCIVCQPIWLIWLGLGSSTFFLIKLSIYLQVASILLLLVSLHLSLRSINGCLIKTLS